MGRVQEMSQNFDEFHIEQITWERNATEDLLANLVIYYGANEWRMVDLEYQDRSSILGVPLNLNDMAFRPLEARPSRTITDINISKTFSLGCNWLFN